MAKTNTVFLCSSCGNEFSKWSGQCPACHDWNTINQLQLPRLSSSRTKRTSLTAISPQEAIGQAAKTTFPSNLPELDRVLGVGLTAGGVYLLAGEPGIGKSTLLTQLALSFDQLSVDVLYVCSEENPSQVGTRLSRLSTKTKPTEHIKLLSVDTLENLLDYTAKTDKLPPLIIVDSIQSVSTEQVAGLAGSPTQIRACTSLLIQLAKSQSVTIILVGHVTKSGAIAGPKLLEHMVDAVLQLEGDRHHDLRLLRGIKNRFGPTDETGLFQMTSQGLLSVPDPSQIFLTSRPQNTPGSALGLIMEGTRPLIVEIQALTVPSELAIPRRVAAGISTTKLQLICAILTRHLHLQLGNQDVFVNVTGGFSLREPAADLAIALAIISSSKNIPLPAKSVAIGELGLLGEIRPVSYLDKRLKEAKTLGYVAAFTPQKYSLLKQIKLSS